MSDQTQMRETIFALSSGTLPSGVAVIRLSGPGVRMALETMTGGVPVPRKAHLCDISDAAGTFLDRGICLFFPGPASFSGEDCAEFQLHGGRAVVAAVLDALAGLQNFRAAEPGEFTKRAFLNGKLDLTGAEALADLISAETEAQRRFALASSETRHRELYQDWRARLIRARALIEAELDFSDEEDVPGSVADAVWNDVIALRELIETHAQGYRDAEIIREGYRVVILGAPNAGKSSLLNALARRDIAIVTEEPGTTRDVLEAALDIDGSKVLVTDTAGIRADPGRVEALGIDRALDRARDADMIILLEDACAPARIEPPSSTDMLRVVNKIDLLGEDDTRADAYDCGISAKTGEGIARLITVLGNRAKVHTRRAGDVLPFRKRHVGLLREACDHLDRATRIHDRGLELQAEELRLAADALGRIAGAIDVEDLLDAIFSQFCIGK